jgi:hypothetical protein
MADGDVADRPADQRAQDRLIMAFDRRSGIDHGDGRAADDVGVGAMEGEGTGIRRGDPHNILRDRNGFAMGGNEFRVERKGHGRLRLRGRDWRAMIDGLWAKPAGAAGRLDA